MLTKTQKKELIKELVDKIKRQKSLVFTDISKLNVGEMQQLRRELKKAGIDYKVAKKTLITLALKEAKQDIDVEQIPGSLGAAFSYDDPISPAKIIFKFAKEHKKLKIVGGMMENRFLTFEEVQSLSKIPSKEELLAILVNSLKGPSSGLVNVLQGNMRNLIGVLNEFNNCHFRRISLATRELQNTSVPTCALFVARRDFFDDLFRTTLAIHATQA